MEAAKACLQFKCNFFCFSNQGVFIILVHVILILNITRYATKVNRQHINTVMQTVERTHNDITTLFNITSSLYTHINYQEILLHICSILANLGDFLYYIRQIALHAMNYINTATTSKLTPHVLPVEDLWEMLIHNKVELPSTMCKPVSSGDTLHFHRYLCTHVLVAEEQFYCWMMYLFRTMHKNLRSTRSCTYSYLKETCQHATT